MDLLVCGSSLVTNLRRLRLKMYKTGEKKSMSDIMDTIEIILRGNLKLETVVLDTNVSTGEGFSNRA